MSFFSTWHDVRSLGIDDSAFIKNFIERSEISLAPLNDGSEQEIVDAMQLIMTLPETEIIRIISEEDDVPLLPPDVPCFSTFSNGAVRINELLEFAPEGLTYAEIGYQLVGATNQLAQIKYGENHAKLASMMSLVTISDHRPANIKSTALGRYLVTVPYEEKASVLKKLLLRDPCVQAIIRAAIAGEAIYRKVVENLSDSTAYRRRTSVKCVIEFALDLPETKHLLNQIVWDL